MTLQRLRHLQLRLVVLELEEAVLTLLHALVRVLWFSRVHDQVFTFISAFLPLNVVERD